jgi:hypothetical protein
MWCRWVSGLLGGRASPFLISVIWKPNYDFDACIGAASYLCVYYLFSTFNIFIDWRLMILISDVNV